METNNLKPQEEQRLEELSHEELVKRIFEINQSIEYYSTGKKNLADERDSLSIQQFINEFNKDHKKIINETIEEHFKVKYSSRIEALQRDRALLFEILKTKNL